MADEHVKKIEDAMDKESRFDHFSDSESDGGEEDASQSVAIPTTPQSPSPAILQPSPSTRRPFLQALRSSFSSPPKSTSPAPTNPSGTTTAQRPQSPFQVVDLANAHGDKQDAAQPELQANGLTVPIDASLGATLSADIAAITQGPPPPTAGEMQALNDLEGRLQLKDETATFNLLSNPRRRIVMEGPVEKIGTEAKIKRTNKRILVLLTDVLLVCQPPVLPPGKKATGREKLPLKQILTLEDVVVWDRSYESPIGFELQGQQRSWVFLAPTQERQQAWVAALKTCLLALLRDTPIADQVGWHHTIIRGTLFSAALLDDNDIMSALIAKASRTVAQGLSRQGAEDEDDEPPSLDEILEEKDDAGMAPVHYAAYRGHCRIIEQLLSNGVSASSTSDTLDTPLHYAAANGHQQAVQLLIDRRADVHARNFQERMPLFDCVLAGERHMEDAAAILAMLREKGAELDAHDSLGMTPIHKAVEMCSLRMLTTLLKLGCDANGRRGSDQATPLQAACMLESPSAEMIRTLLAYGAMPNKAERGKRPLEHLLGSKLHESGDPGDVSEPTSETTALTDSERQALSARLPAILELLRHGGRCNTKRLVRLGVDAKIVEEMVQAMEEWGAKTGAPPAGAGLENGGLPSALDRDEWVKDSVQTKCTFCTATFSFTFRKHHCRSCGGLVCGNCSTKKLLVSAAGNGDRVCDVCFNVASRKRKELTAGVPTPPRPPTAEELAEKERRDREVKRLLEEEQRRKRAARENQELLGGKADSVSALQEVRERRAADRAARAKGGVGETKNIMAQNMELLNERGEKLSRLSEKTRAMEQSAADFAQMARQLAKKEQEKKWSLF